MTTKPIIFLDIETVPSTNNFSELPERIKDAWGKKSNYLRTDISETDHELFDTKAGIFAEFGRIICISVGIETQGKNGKQLRIKSFYGDDERVLLSEFIELVNTKFDQGSLHFCAHNGKEFDFPYICRRILINRLIIPESLNIAGKKPWEVKHLDTMDLWKFGDYKHYTSLELLAAIFNIETSKDDIDGSQVARVYYNEKNGLERVKTYCEKDVSVLAQIYYALTSQEAIKPENINFIA